MHSVPSEGLTATRQRITASTFVLELLHQLITKPGWNSAAHQAGAVERGGVRHIFKAKRRLGVRRAVRGDNYNADACRSMGENTCFELMRFVI